MAGTNRIDDIHEHDRHTARGIDHRLHRRYSVDKDDIGLERKQVRRTPAHLRVVCRPHAVFDPDVAANGPAPFPQSLMERRHPGLPFGIVRGQGAKHSDAPHPFALLPARGERPCGCRAADKRDELAALDHSITSSARASSVGGISTPRAFAVLRLITSSYLVGACTGRSAGFSPLRMRST